MVFLCSLFLKLHNKTVMMNRNHIQDPSRYRFVVFSLLVDKQRTAVMHSYFIGSRRHLERPSHEEHRSIAVRALDWVVP